MNRTEIKKLILNGAFDSAFEKVYPQSPPEQVRSRFAGALDAFGESFGEKDGVRIFSAPGRTEIGGNHTDHQHGRVLAAAVDMDILCIAALNGGDVIRVRSEGYPLNTIGLTGLIPRAEEKNSSAALIRGIAAACKDRGYEASGFDAYMTSNVMKGSGLSSSAAFEVAVGTIINGLSNGGGISAVEIARMGQYAENIFFGKPSGLMDQMACSVGGFISIDFEEPENPLIEKVGCDFSKSGYKLCIVDTKGSHADLTHEYAAIPEEMLSVAAFFGKRTLREVDENIFYSNISGVREQCGDRAALRAIHFFGDNARVAMQAQALGRGDFSGFLEMVVDSGRSSAMYLQNLFSCEDYNRQGLSLACAVSERLLSRRGGAWRVQGGGFAGTIEAFVPDALAEEYTAAMERLFGKDSCHLLSIRPFGGMEITIDKEEHNG